MNELIERLRAPRTLRSRLLRLLVARTSAFFAVVSVLLMGNVMSLSPTAAPFDAKPITLPSWSAAEQAQQPDCVRAADWPAGKPASAVVVHRFNDGETLRMPFMTAWKANHNATDVDDVWVLGICP